MKKTYLLILACLLPVLAFSLVTDKSPKNIKPRGIHTIVIDAGHGGKDPGCAGSTAWEKNIALSIAKKLAQKIQDNFPSVKVILTRDTDVFIPLYERAAIANRNNADLFISIHCNAMPPHNEGTNGTETYVMGLHTAEHNLAVAKRENASILLEADYEKNYDYDPNSPEGHIMLSMYQNAFLEQSILIADLVESQFKIKDNRKSRGVKQAGFVVLKETTMPSILVETGFLTNKDDEAYLFTDDGQNETATSIFKAFEAYKKEVESGLNIPTAPVVTNSSSQKKTTKSTPQPSSQPQPKEVSFTPRPSQLTKKGGRPKPYPNAIKKSKDHTTFSSKAIVKTPTVPQSHSVPKSKPSSKNQANNTPVVAPIERPISYTKDDAKPIHFKVQMATSSHLINTNTAPWNQHRYMIEIIQEGGVYKYQATNFGNYQRALKAKNNLRLNGFPDAFIVAYQDGKRIPINKAKKILGIGG